jgi:ABC-2 type transport system permease protein
VIDVFVFLTARSLRNRIVRQLRRLREPRYLVPTAVSVLWIGFWMSNAFLRGGGRPPGLFDAFLGADVRNAFAIIAGACLFVWAALLWLVPSEGAALEFTPAEIHLLFPAPVTRRQIVHYKLLRAQLGILFGALITSFFWGKGLLGPDGLTRLAGIWLLYATLHLHTLGSGFTRTSLIEHGVSGLRRRLVPLAVLLAVVVGAVVGVMEAWPELVTAAANITGEEGRFSRRGFADFAVAIGRVGTSGVLGVILAPFAIFPHLVLSRGLPEFLRWFGPAIVLLLLHYLWVVRSDAAFEEASVEAAQKRAARIAARRTTARQGGVLRGAVRAFPWKLSPRGRPFVAIVWKNLVSLVRVTPVRALIVLGAILFAGLTWTSSRGEGAPLTLIFAVLLALLALFTSVFGPLFVRNDLREDLFHIDAVKTFPLSGKAIVFGELLAPWIVLAAMQAVFLLGSLTAFGAAGTASSSNSAARRSRRAGWWGRSARRCSSCRRSRWRSSRSRTRWSSCSRRGSRWATAARAASRRRGSAC